MRRNGAKKKIYKEKEQRDMSSKNTKHNMRTVSKWTKKKTFHKHII